MEMNEPIIDKFAGRTIVYTKFRDLTISLPRFREKEKLITAGIMISIEENRIVYVSIYGIKRGSIFDVGYKLDINPFEFISFLKRNIKLFEEIAKRVNNLYVKRVLNTHLEVLRNINLSEGEKAVRKFLISLKLLL